MDRSESISKEGGPGTYTSKSKDINPCAHGWGNAHARLGTSTAWGLRPASLPPTPNPSSLGLGAQSSTQVAVGPISTLLPLGHMELTVVV